MQQISLQPPALAGEGPLRMWIGGRGVPPVTGQNLPVIDPGSGETVGSIGRGGREDIDAAVASAKAALVGAWGRTTAVDRGRLLLRLSGEILAEQERIAEAEAIDTGKPLKQAISDVSSLARYFEYYGGAADKVHGETIPFQNGYTAFTLREPHGVTGHIIPWNYPVQMFGRSVAPALAMGNACVVKPAEDASLTSLMLGELASRVGLPDGVLNVVTGLGSEAGAALAGHPDIAFISFTGSPAAGASVQQAAAIHHHPIALELGGKSPQILFEDADQDAALPMVLGAIIQHAGQTCSAGSRLLVHDAIYDGFVAKVAERFSALVVGSGRSNPDIGPVINAAQRDRIERYLALAECDGRVKIVAQGSVAPDAPAGGFFVKPTLIGDVPPSHCLAQEEIFGPVLVATRFKSEAEVVEIANGTPYGLVAGVWTQDGGRQLRMARALKCGQVYVNNYGAGGGVELPFGGVKRSGHGREKGFEALLHFSTTKTVAIHHGEVRT